MDYFTASIISIHEEAWRLVRLKRELERGFARLSHKVQAVLMYIGIDRLLDILKPYEEESEVEFTAVIFGDVIESQYGKAVTKTNSKEIEKLEKRKKILRFCVIKPVQISDEIGISHDCEKEVVEMTKKSNVEYVMHQSKCFHVSTTRFEIYDILKQYGVKIDKLWMVNNLNDGDIAGIQFSRICSLLSEELAKVRDNFEMFFSAKTNRYKIEDIVNSVCDETCSKENLTHISRSIKLRNETDDEYVGDVSDSPYRTRRNWVIKQLRDQLVDEILKTLSDSISKEVKDRFDDFMKGLVHVEHSLDDTTTEMIKQLLPDDIVVAQIKTVLMLLFSVVKDFLVSVVMVVVSFFNPVDVNSISWRENIAVDISKAIWKQRGEITAQVTDKICSQVFDLESQVRPSLFTFLEELKGILPRESQLESFKQGDVRYYTELDYLDEKVHRSACREVRRHLNDLIPIEIYPADKQNNQNLIVSIVSNTGDVLEKNFQFRSKELKSEEFTVFVKQYGKTSVEVQRINKYKQDNDIKVDRQLQKKAKRIINKVGEDIMRYHSNVTSLGVSTVISSKEGRKIVQRTCIVFYCVCKGIIPLAESIFPTQIDGIPVDVREGFTIPAVGGTRYCNPLNLGCSIGLQGRLSGGSIGLFLQEKDNNNIHGFVTCYHVLLDVDQLGSDCCVYNGSGHAVMQPSEPDRENWNRNQLPMNDVEMVDEACTNFAIPGHISSGASPYCTQVTVGDAVCGKLRHAFHGNVLVQINATEMDSFGVDAAYVQITSRDPYVPCFPDIADNLKRIFQKEELDIGSVKDEIIEDDVSFVVYKYGKTTGLTRGIFDSSGSLLKMKVGNAFRCLHNQYEVISSAENRFFDLGDSGAAIFEKNGNSVHCIGLGVAVSDVGSSRCFITPIKAVLTALSGPVSNCPDLEVRKF